MATGFLYDPRYLLHDTGEGHPECPARITATVHYLKTLPWFGQLIPLTPRRAEIEWVEAVHSPFYIKHAEETCKANLPILDTPDVGICHESFDIALLAAGGTLELADQVMHGKIKNGFALLRPPGHHAEQNQALGFCLFNNIAILAKYLQKQYGLDKILILDWDVHHGNGTQHSFYEDPSVLYVSLHQYPFYPGTGAANETGEGRGKGTTLNCPMPAGAGDKDYENAFTEKILPKVRLFKPEAILISAGFDAHAEDPLAHICLSTEFFGWMSERMVEIADQFSNGRLISLLEGGYNLQVLPLCVAEHFAVLSENS
jgi:acetoin utilization deacetylase AcuC-like enzyme